MKVILVRYHDEGNVNTRLPTSLNKVQGTLPPLGISYVASYLEKMGHDVNIVDAIASGVDSEKLRTIIRKVSPKVVGVTSMTASVRGSLEACKIAKECGTKVVIGGSQLSAYPEETLSYEFIDFGVIGDGEIPMAKLLHALENCEEYRHIRGLVYKDGGRIVNNGPYILTDLDQLPPPAYHLLPMEKYSSIIGLHPVSTMITTRGCPYLCGYCFKQPTDRSYRCRNPISVVEEMEYLVNNYSVKQIMFYDDTIAVNRANIEQMCEVIMERNLNVKWEAPCRVDNIDLSLLKLMAKSGCVKLRFGVENGNERILRLMNKNLSLEQVERVFKWCKDVNIETLAYFIIGYIDEDESTIRETIDFAKKIDPDFTMFTIATPYPFTDLFNMAVKKGLVCKDYWRDFTLGERDDRIPFLVENSDYWVKKAYREFYFRPKYILKNILKIDSMDYIKKMLNALKGLAFYRTNN